MKEIKFRVFANDEMWPVKGLACSDNQDHMDLVDHSSDGQVKVHDYDEIEFEPYALMQYTGLKDRNGVEIFEGDILRTDLSRPYNVVVFRNGAFMYQCHDSGRDYFDFMGPSDDEGKTSLEVIGNIYEHGQSLKLLMLPTSP